MSQVRRVTNKLTGRVTEVGSEHWILKYFNWDSLPYIDIPSSEEQFLREMAREQEEMELDSRWVSGMCSDFGPW